MDLLERLNNDLIEAREAGHIPVGINLGYAEMGMFLQEMALKFPDVDLRDPPVRFNLFRQLPVHLYDAETHIGIRIPHQEEEIGDEYLAY